MLIIIMIEMEIKNVIRYIILLGLYNKLKSYQSRINLYEIIMLRK